MDLLFFGIEWPYLLGHFARIASLQNSSRGCDCIVFGRTTKKIEIAKGSDSKQ